MQAPLICYKQAYEGIAVPSTSERELELHYFQVYAPEPGVGGFVQHLQDTAMCNAVEKLANEMYNGSELGWDALIEENMVINRYALFSRRKAV